MRFRDNGPGIPDEARESIFVPFYTTKEKGTGLGLAICQRIVKAHQGNVAVNAAPGGGAEFVVSLPGMREERPQALDDSGVAPGASPAQRRRRRKRRRA